MALGTNKSSVETVTGSLVQRCTRMSLREMRRLANTLLQIHADPCTPVSILRPAPVEVVLGQDSHSVRMFSQEELSILGAYPCGRKQGCQ